MKQIAALLLLFAAVQTTAQSNTYTVSMNGIGEIKVGMKKADLDKVLGQPVKLVHLVAKEDYEWDTVRVEHKGLTADVVLAKEYADQDRYSIIVQEIRSSHPQLRTPSGISIGDDKFKVLSVYDGYMIYIIPEYENNYTVKSKTKSIVMVHSDESGKVITFYLNSNKVTAMSVGYNMGD